VFEIAQPDPFMTIAPRVRAAFKNRIAAAVHVDGTGRIQTVSKDENPRYHAIISAFERLTGVPVVINTSFNEQEPIVAHPREAVACFMRTEIDVLVLENRYVTRAGVKIPR
jgi:carbamoyltransferase